MNVKRLTFTLLPITVCLLLCEITGCSMHMQTDFSAQAAPTLVAITFYSENSRWPTSRVELVECAGKDLNLNSRFTNEVYSTLTLDVQTNGSLIIHGELAPPGKGNWTTHLGQPNDTRY